MNSHPSIYGSIAIPIAVVTQEFPTMPTALAVDVAKSVERRALGRATGHRDAYV